MMNSAVVLLPLLAGLSHAATVDQCSSKCVLSGISATGCAAIDSSCICSSKHFMSAVEECVVDACHGKQQDDAVELAQAFCRKIDLAKRGFEPENGGGWAGPSEWNHEDGWWGDEGSDWWHWRDHEHGDKKHHRKGGKKGDKHDYEGENGGWNWPGWNWPGWRGGKPKPTGDKPPGYPHPHPSPTTSTPKSPEHTHPRPPHYPTKEPTKPPHHPTTTPTPPPYHPTHHHGKKPPGYPGHSKPQTVIPYSQPPRYSQPPKYNGGR